MKLEDYETVLNRMASATKESHPEMFFRSGTPDYLTRDNMTGLFFLEVIRLRERVEDLETKLYGG